MTRAQSEPRRWALAALANLETLYPFQAQHVTSGPADVMLPATRHPAFHSCYDWHSCVHMHWLLVRLARCHPTEVPCADITQALNQTLTPEAVAAEVAYLRANPAFERPYGWAWALVLCAETAHAQDDRGGNPDVVAAARGWHDALEPLADLLLGAFTTWIDSSIGPVRNGVHDNSAFALTLLAASGHGDLAARAARSWYLDDRDAPVAYEPSGLDFLSPTLTEAHAMSLALDPTEFRVWADAFLPARFCPTDAWLRPPAPRDLVDPRQGHLIGLALSRAWSARSISRLLDAPRASILRATADANEAWARSLVDSDLGFQHAHWLATFAYLAACCAPDAHEESTVPNLENTSSQEGSA